MLLLLIPFTVEVTSYALNEGCGEQNTAVHNACKRVKYKELPAEVKKLMKKLKCDVKTGSSYDWGYALDLNADGHKEYAFCCEESPHGPCGMKIFGKLSGTWKELFGYMAGFSDDKTPCFGFVVLNEKHNKYNDICINDGSRDIIIRFDGGKYVEGK